MEENRMLIVTPSEMEAIDRETISHYGLPSQVLMENAARTVLPYVPPGPVKLLIGPGNNGGDGLVLARALQEQGRDVEALLFSKTLSKEAETQRQLALNWGVPMRSFYNDDDTRTPRFLENGVIIDALFGTGLARELTGRYARTLEVANRSNAYRLAIDIPSGIDGTTGKVLSTAFQADLTVTFGRIKWGQLLFPGKTHCGQTVLTQPGFHPEALKKFERAQYVEHSLAAKLLPQTWPTMHKGDNGRVLLLTGSENYPELES